MRHTVEQHEERQWFAELVAQTGTRYRVTDDVEGWPMIPGRLGRVEWGGDRERLTVYTTRVRMAPKLLAIPGVRRWQTGDRETRLWFPAEPEILRAVCSVIRARVRRAGGPGNLEALARARGAPVSPAVVA